MAATVERRDQLAARLEDGWHRIEQAEAAGQDATEWTRFWESLLIEYQDVCRDLDALHDIPQQVPPLDTPCNEGDPMQPQHQADQRSLLLGGF